MARLHSMEYPAKKLLKIIALDIYIPVLTIGISAGIISFVADALLSIYGNPFPQVLWDLFYGFFMTFLAIGLLLHIHKMLQMTEASITIIWTWFFYVFVYSILYSAANFLSLISFDYPINLMSTFIIWLLVGTINAIFWKFMSGVFGYTRWYALSTIKIDESLPESEYL